MSASWAPRCERIGPASAPAILCLHGFLGEGRDWRPVAERLAGRFQFLLVDLPGHGESLHLDPAAYTLEGVGDGLAGLAAEARGLMGYSMGGRLALAGVCAGRFAPRALALLSASPGLEEERARAARLAEDAARAERLAADGLPAFLQGWYQQPLFRSLAARPDLLAELGHRRARGDAAELARALTGFSVGRQTSCWPALERLAPPVLWVAGEDDPAYAVLARRAAGLSPAGDLLILPHAGHMPHLEQPDACAAGLEAFFSKHLE